MDVGSVNIPYLLSEGDDILRIVCCSSSEHFGLLTEERLKGLTMIIRDLPMIDIAELVRLQICEELDDTWAWGCPGDLRRQQVPAAGAPEFTEGAPNVDEGFLVLLKLMLLVMIITAAAYVSTAGEDCWNTLSYYCC
ncbi:hypothetical protein Tco_1401179 [Tanacetum coccineum]